MVSGRPGAGSGKLRYELRKNHAARISFKGWVRFFLVKEAGRTSGKWRGAPLWHRVEVVPELRGIFFRNRRGTGKIT